MLIGPLLSRLYSCRLKSKQVMRHSGTWLWSTRVLGSHGQAGGLERQAVRHWQKHCTPMAEELAEGSCLPAVCMGARRSILWEEHQVWHIWCTAWDPACILDEHCSCPVTPIIGRAIGRIGVVSATCCAIFVAGGFEIWLLQVSGILLTVYSLTHKIQVYTCAQLYTVVYFTIPTLNIWLTQLRSGNMPQCWRCEVHNGEV